MKKFAGFFVLGAFFLSILVQAQERSPLESYRVDTHYGPKVSVLKSLYDKDSKFQFKLGALASPYSSLYSSYGAQVGGTYFWNSRWGWEIFQAKYFKTSLSSFLQGEGFNSVRQQASASIEVPQFIVSSGIHWSPVYAKLQMTQQSLIHFDVYTGLGVALAQNELRNLNYDILEKTKSFGGVVKTGIRIWLPPRWTAEFEIEDMISKADNFSVSSISHTLSLNLSLGLFFGSFE